MKAKIVARLLMATGMFLATPNLYAQTGDIGQDKRDLQRDKRGK